MRKLKCKAKGEDEDEIKDESAWFKVKGKALRFGEKEFSLLTGFLVGEDGNFDKTQGKESRLVTRYFMNRKLIKRKDLYDVFVGQVDNDFDRYKLGLLVILAYVVVSSGESTPIEWWWFQLVDDLRAFNRYPWGSVSYKSTIYVFKREMKEWFNKDTNIIKYSLYGFPAAIMVWAFESIPSLGVVAKLYNKKAIPRMNKWEVNRYIPSSKIDVILEDKQVVVVVPILRPTELERQRLFFLKFDDEKEGVSNEEEEENKEQKFDNENEENEENEEEENKEPKIDNENLRDVVRNMVKEEIRVAVMEETKAIHVVLESMQRTLDMLVSNKSKSVEGETVKGKDEGKDEGNVNVEKGNNRNGVLDKTDDDGKGDDDNDGVSMETELNKGDDDEDGVQSLPLTVKLGNKIVMKRKWCEKKPVVKRRKLKKVDSYDPYREGDAKLMDYVESLIKNTDDCALVRLLDDELTVGELKEIAKGGCLSTNVLNAALCLVRRRILAYPDLFEVGAGIMDTYFCNYIIGEHQKIAKLKNMKNFQFSKALIAYVNGYTPLTISVIGSNPVGMPWEEINYLYMPVCERSHFFLLRIDLKGRKIYVFDSLPTHIRKSVFNRWILPIRVMIPLLRTLVKGYEDYSLEELDYERLEGLPVQNNGSECGMFCLKYLEFLTGKVDMKSIEVEKMMYWRKKLVGELVAWDFDP